jgi:hypothetical protein
LSSPDYSDAAASALVIRPGEVGARGIRTPPIETIALPLSYDENPFDRLSPAGIEPATYGLAVNRIAPAPRAIFS